MSSTDALMCNATFKANPDVAGLGVLIAFEATAWLTILFALFPAATSLWASIRSWLSLPEPLEDPSWVARLPRVTDAVMMPLCDLQIVTGISILTAGFVMLKEATFYHQQITLQLWWLTLNSFWVARVEIERRYASQNDLPRKSYALTLDSPAWNLMRKLGVFCSIVLGVSYQSITQAQQEWDWDPEVGGLCYMSHDNTSGWIWTVGTGVYAFTLLLIIIPWTLPIVESFFKFLEGRQNKLFFSCKTYWRKPLFDPEQPLAIFGRLSLKIASTTGLVLFWCAMHFLTIWSYGSGWYPVLILAEVGFAIWSTYDIVDLKVSNVHLMDGDENAWGFGQVLPMVLLSLIGFQAIDAWYRSRQTKVKIFPNRIEPLENYNGILDTPLELTVSDNVSIPPLAALRNSAVRREWWAESENLKALC